MGDPAKYEPPTVDLSLLKGGPFSVLPTILSMGGSTVPKIMLGVYQGPHGAYLTLTGRGEPVEGPQLARGHEMEAVAVGLDRPRLSALGIEVVELWDQGTFKRTPTMHATPDRLLIRDGRVVGHQEAKSVNNQHRRLDIYREDWWLQCQHTNWVLDGALEAGSVWDYESMNESTLVALAAPEPVFDHLRRILREKGLDAAIEEARELVVSGVAELQIRHVGIEPSYAQETVPKLEAWFEKHVIGDTPPPVDGTEECWRALNLSAGNREGSMEMRDNVASLASRQIVIDAEIKSLKEEKSLNKNKLMLAMGRFGEARGQGVRIKVGTRKNPDRLNVGKARAILEKHNVNEDEYIDKGRPSPTLTVKEYEEKPEEIEEVSA